MEQKNGCLFLLLFVFLLTHALSVSSSASTFISDDVFGDQASIGRNLLQAKKSISGGTQFWDVPNGGMLPQIAYLGRCVDFILDLPDDQKISEFCTLSAEFLWVHNLGDQGIFKNDFP